MTEIPEEFKHLTRCMHDGIFEENENERGVVEAMLQMQTPEQLVVIKRFLNAALLECDGPGLQRAWNSGGPVYGIADDNELRTFLTLIRDMIK